MTEAQELIDELAAKFDLSGLNAESRRRWEYSITLLAWVLPRLRDPDDRNACFNMLLTAMEQSRWDGLADAIEVCERLAAAHQSNTTLTVVIKALRRLEVANRNGASLRERRPIGSSVPLVSAGQRRRFWLSRLTFWRKPRQT